MSEKFFYREINKNNQTKRLDLQGAFTNALLGDVTPPTLPTPRKIEK
ncbi:hypothetical protein KBB48_03695 [Candidatus Shapirobacteria bacterium]|nr:hypothetical protein [Candidatus Shapirobacteria bacterium]